MNFKQHYSGSTGNLYTLEHNGHKLLIECGVSESKIREAINFKLHDYCGCLITHEHKDHSFAAWNIARSGVGVYASKGTMEAITTPLKVIPYTRVVALEVFDVGCFTILPFATEHDCNEPLGFLIHDGNEKLLFATDTYFIRHRFTGLTQIAIECNWSEGTLNSELDHSVYERLKRSHLSLERLCKMLLSNDLSLVKEIHLLHVSKGNGNSSMFVEKIQQLTGIPTYCLGVK